MADINMKRAIALNENNTPDNIDEQVIEYISRVANIAEMDEQFWNDFILGAAMWSITAGYTGAW